MGREGEIRYKKMYASYAFRKGLELNYDFAYLS